MKYLLDVSKTCYPKRVTVWPDIILGQLLTPLTMYRRCTDIFGIDNGCYSGFTDRVQRRFKFLLKREWDYRENCLFACVPDKIGCHKTTLKMWNDLNHLCDGYKKAFVAQDGFDFLPPNADALFIGGTNKFKDSVEIEAIVKNALDKNIHVHIGRVNYEDRFKRFHEIGANTCDGSAICRYDWVIEKLKQNLNGLYNTF